MWIVILMFLDGSKWFDWLLKYYWSRQHSWAAIDHWSQVGHRSNWTPLNHWSSPGRRRKKDAYGFWAWWRALHCDCFWSSVIKMASDSVQDRHRPGVLKQQNKAHKHGRHRSKGAVDNAAKGTVLPHFVFCFNMNVWFVPCVCSKYCTSALWAISISVIP